MFAKKTPEVSVCIPVMGTEKYLGRCLESVAGQEFSGIEIIVVDDSPVSSREAKEIVNEFNKRHKKSAVSARLIAHGKNKGLVEARRTALYDAKGEYIMFLDSDDALAEGAVKTLFEEALASGADIVHGKAQVRVEDGNEAADEELKNRVEDMRKKSGKVYEGELLGRQIFDGFLVEGNHAGFLWGKIFRKEACLKAFAEIPPVYCIFGEDFLTYFFISYFSQKYAGTGKTVYNYYVNTGITSNKKIESLEEWQKVCSTASVFTVLLSWAQEIKAEAEKRSAESEGRCGETSPLEGAAEDGAPAGARGRLSPLEPLTDEEEEKLGGICRCYVANNLAQLEKSVAAELQGEAFKMLFDFWGEKLVKEIKAL